MPGRSLVERRISPPAANNPMSEPEYIMVLHRGADAEQVRLLESMEN